jgi:hypothetical protein
MVVALREVLAILILSPARIKPVCSWLSPGENGDRNDDADTEFAEFAKFATIP